MTVVARGTDEGFLLTEAQEDELLAAMAEIERGEYMTLEELLQALPRHDTKFSCHVESSTGTGLIEGIVKQRSQEEER